MEASKIPTFITGVDITEYHPDELGADLDAIVAGVTEATQATLLLKKRKEMREVTDELEFMKEVYANRMESCNERYKEYQRKLHDMNEQVMKFERFVNENDSKRRKAEAKTKSEKKSIDLLVQQIQQETENLREKKIEKEQLENQLNKLRKYRDFLSQTVEQSKEDFEEIIDILNRHKTLVDAHSDLEVDCEIIKEKVDNLRQQMTLKRESAQNQILTKNNDIHLLQKNVEDIRAFESQVESEMENRLTRHKDTTMICGQVTLAIRNLYTRMFQSYRFKHKPVEDSKTRSTIDVLTDYLEELKIRIMDLQELDEKYPLLRDLHSPSSDSPRKTRSASSRSQGSAILNSKGNKTNSEFNSQSQMSQPDMSEEKSFYSSISNR